jgi:hypothetical protein
MVESLSKIEICQMILVEKEPKKEQKRVYEYQQSIPVFIFRPDREKGEARKRKVH